MAFPTEKENSTDKRVIQLKWILSYNISTSVANFIKDNQDIKIII